MSRKIIALLLSALVLCALCAFASLADGTNAVADSAEVKTVGAAVTAVESKDQPIGLVIGMGVGVVFFGLICIVILSMIMSAIVRATDKKSADDTPASKTQSAPASPAASELSPEKRREVIAAVSAVIAEELGTDVSAIRVTSFKRV